MGKLPSLTKHRELTQEEKKKIFEWADEKDGLIDSELPAAYLNACALIGSMSLEYSDSAFLGEMCNIYPRRSAPIGRAYAIRNLAVKLRDQIGHAILVRLEGR